MDKLYKCILKIVFNERVFLNTLSFLVNEMVRVKKKYYCLSPGPLDQTWHKASLGAGIQVCSNDLFTKQ